MRMCEAREGLLPSSALSGSNRIKVLLLRRPSCSPLCRAHLKSLYSHNWPLQSYKQHPQLMCMDTHTHAHTHYSTFCTSSVPGLFADLPSSPLLLATITLAPWGLAAPSGPCAPCSDNWSVQRCLFHWALTLHLAAHTHRLNIPKDSTLCMAVKCYVFRFPSMTDRKPYKRPIKNNHVPFYNQIQNSPWLKPNC